MEERRGGGEGTGTWGNNVGKWGSKMGKRARVDGRVGMRVESNIPHPSVSFS